MMERDVELRIKGRLYEIASGNDEVLESRQGFPASESGYMKTLESVVDVAGPDPMDEMAAFTKEYIQDHHERPANQTVRIEARSRVSKAGYPPDEYLNAA
jgi:hypothetical protein